jgi:uncharacterized protein YlzI (FlbEa/FlbD family)
MATFITFVGLNGEAMIINPEHIVGFYTDDSTSPLNLPVTRIVTSSGDHFQVGEDLLKVAGRLKGQFNNCQISTSEGSLPVSFATRAPIREVA